MLISLDHISHLKLPLVMSREMDKQNNVLLPLPHHDGEAIIYIQM